MDEPCAGVHLVHDHVLKLLIVDRSHVYVSLERLSRDTRCQEVLSTVAVSVLDKDARHVLHFRSTESGSVLQLSSEHTSCDE